jgi:D-arabinose 1-dehydrogenase-like Zn-dependent alcohol dehydrogenase
MQTIMPQQLMTRALTLDRPGRPLQLMGRARGAPQSGQILLRVGACAVCRTALHIVDGELPWPDHPVVRGREVVGTGPEVGVDFESFAPGVRVGVPWLEWTCSRCHYCLSRRKNLCDRARFTGYQMTRQDALDFRALAPKVPGRTTVETFPLPQANEALARLRAGRINGAAVLVS